MHLTDGQLRAYLDGELSEAEARHLPACQACQDRLAAIQARAGRTGQRLAFLAQSSDEILSPVGRHAASLPLPALARFKTRINAHKEIPMLSIFSQRRWRPVWIGLAVFALVLALLSVPQMRAWAGQFLGIFRVKQVAPIPVDLTGLTQLKNNSALSSQIGQLISNTVTVTRQPGKPQAVASAADASQMAHFNVRLPAGQAETPYLTVQNGAAFKFKVDRARAQALLDEAGRSDLKLPASLDGTEVTVDIPAAVSAAYGNCPHLDQENNDEGFNLGIKGPSYASCVMLAEIPSPTIDAPPDLDLASLVQIGLEFSGMTAAQAKAFSETVDWTSSLVIPIPKNAATYRTVMVDGVSGTLIQRPRDDAPEYALVWVKDGIIYVIGSLSTDSARAIDMANNMP